MSNKTKGWLMLSPGIMLILFIFYSIIESMTMVGAGFAAICVLAFFGAYLIQKDD